MPIFYSPTGNPEIWKEKPEGYFSVEEYQEKFPSKSDNISLDELKKIKLNILDFLSKQTLEQLKFFSSMNFKFSANDSSYINILNTEEQMKRSSVDTVKIFDLDFVEHTLSLAEIQILKSEISQARTILYKYVVELKNKISTASTVNEVAEVVFNFENF